MMRQLYTAPPRNVYAGQSQIHIPYSQQIAGLHGDDLNMPPPQSQNLIDSGVHSMPQSSASFVPGIINPQESASNRRPSPRRRQQYSESNIAGLFREKY